MPNTAQHQATTDAFALRRQFMQRFDMPPPATPQFDAAVLAMWHTMLQEELQELQQALADYRQLPQADADTGLRLRAELTAEGVDVLNVVIGLLLSQGLPLERMFEAIHAANLAKCVGGRVVRRADGKVLKPEGWQPADKVAVIAASQAEAAA